MEGKFKSKPENRSPIRDGLKQEKNSFETASRDTIRLERWERRIAPIAQEDWRLDGCVCTSIVYPNEFYRKYLLCCIV